MVDSLLRMKERIHERQLKPSLSKSNEMALACISEAIEAGLSGNYPVGAVITDSEFNLISRGRNEVFYPTFKSAAHAEMMAVTAFEAGEKSGIKNPILFTTLEPCMMCTARILLSNVRQVIYLLLDPAGGLISHNRNHLPPNYHSLFNRISFSECHEDQEVKQLAGSLYEIGEQIWNQKYNL